MHENAIDLLPLPQVEQQRHLPQRRCVGGVVVAGRAAALPPGELKPRSFLPRDLVDVGRGAKT